LWPFGEQSKLLSIDQLPKRDQDALFRTIDAFLQARKAS